MATFTVTRTIVGINPIGNNIWQIEFNPAQTRLTLASETFPIIYLSSSALPVVLNPYLNNIGNWNTNDYNALINNADGERLSTFYKQVDYSTNQNIPVNFEQIISGSAYPAAVQDSNYTSNWYTIPRYIGSKNTTDNLNSTSLTQSFVVQDYQNSDIGATTLGQPSIDLYNTNIYEFAWGGGTYPQIATGGALKLTQILNVDTTSSIATISPQDTFFPFTVQSNLPPNSQPQITQRTTTANIPNTARVLSSAFGVPPVSSYYIPSGSTLYGGASTTGSFSTLSLFGGFLTNLIAIPVIGSSGYETLEAAVTGSTVTDAVNNISSSLSAGERWFVSIYYNLGPTASGSLTPVNNSYNAISGDGSYNYPLEYNGVYEIDSVSSTHANVLILTNPINVSLEMGSQASVLASGTAPAGCLIWKAITDGTFVTFNGTTLSGVGKGNLITPNASPIIKSNLNSIITNSGI